MPAPTAYTEPQLLEYMHRQLAPVADALDWGQQAELEDALHEALLAYGVSLIADATDIRKLRALARREAWRKAVGWLAARYQFSADGTAYSRNQQFEQAQQRLRAAEVDALVYEEHYAIRIDAVSRPHDPYAYVEDEDRVIP